jgi:alpha-tubulin suppressor-like RCC1 family protein
LGNGTVSTSAGPVEVSGLGSGVAAMAAGYQHTCALMAGGAVKCWGSNRSGQVGDGTWDTRFTPADVGGLGSGVAAIAAGFEHSCALTAGGGVKCWGKNTLGQLGNGTTDDRNAPVDVLGLSSGVAAIAAGSFHTCALTTAGGVKCWGSNEYGQLGDGTTAARDTLVEVSGLDSGAIDVAAGGAHSCALLAAGQVQCWGRNSSGQLGAGATGRLPPVNVTGLDSGVTALAARFVHTCALTTGSGVKCWGDNGFGRLGDGTMTDRYLPVDVSGLASGVAAVTAGSGHTCALLAAGGTVKCWGENFSGQIGDGTTLTRTTPVDAAGLAGITALGAGGGHTCALTAGGGVKCWGGNVFGQLGDGTLDNRLTAVEVSGLGSGVVALTAGQLHACVLTHAGQVQCWGSNLYGQLGAATTELSSTIPVAVSGLGAVTALAAGGFHTCALLAAGGVQCWGDNAYGQLGDGTRDPRGTPVVVSGLAGATALAAGTFHTCALTTGGSVKCWGDHGLGAGSGSMATVDGVDGEVTALAAGLTHSCAVVAGGGVMCWGDNSVGQLGVNPGWAPVAVVELRLYRALLPLLRR